MSKLSKHTLRPKCSLCGLQSHTTEQHDPSKQRNPDASLTCTTTQQYNHSNPCPPDKSSLLCANYASTTDSPSVEDDLVPLDPEVYATISELPDTDCTVDSINEDIVFICSGASILSPTPEASTWFYDGLHAGVFAALSHLVKTMLDSGCTMHLFKDKKYFWSYREDEAVDVKTANCGVLSTKAHGEIRICVKCTNGQHIVVRLLDCLHAPDVPMNLISISALTERRMYLLFGNNWTSINFPKDHPSLSGVRFAAAVLGRLSFLDCEILEPDSSTVDPLANTCSMAMPEPFRHTKPNRHTWHCRLGHPGQDLTSDVINGGCATGIISHGPNTKLICPSCLVGKHAQKPFEQNGNRAQFVNELIHIDTCGPFPTASPQGARYFFAMLEDKTTAAEVKMMKRKNKAFRHFETTVAKWEQISGRPVMFMRSDNAPEFVESDMGKFLRQKGIRHQQCVPYAHQQNGKIERFIRTIKERALTLLAHSGLPASFLADAILTVAYLYMWLPNSSIPKDTTPFEQLYSKKPDLSHLRVWGCRCWVTIPREK